MQRLKEDVPLAKYDRRSLAQLLAQLTQFMEDALGVNVSASCSRQPCMHPSMLLTSR